MVARHSLVQGQGREFVQRALVEVAGVDHVAAGYALFHRAAEIAAGGVALLDLAGHGADAVGQARQLAEQGGQAVVGPLGHLRRLLQQGLAARGVELRVAAHEGEEGGEVAGPTGGAHLFIHAGADAGDLLLSDLVDLVRGQVGGGVAPDQEGVEVPPAGAVHEAEAFGGPGQIVLAQETDPLAPGRHHLFGHGPGGALAQLGLFGGGDDGGQIGEGFQQGIGVGRMRRLGLHQGQGALDRRAGLNHAGLQAAPGGGQFVCVGPRHGLQPADPGLGVLARGDPRRAGHVAEGLAGAALGVEGAHPAGIQRNARERPLQQVGEEGVVQAVVVRQPGRVDGRQAGGESTQRRRLGELEGAGGVRQL